MSFTAIDDPCIKNKVIISLSVCLGIISILAIVKLVDSGRYSYTKYKSITDTGKHFLGFKLNVVITIVVCILILFPFISKGFFGGCSVNNQKTPGDLVVVILSGIFSLEEAKLELCNSITKCGSPDELIIDSYRVYETETRLAFRGIAGNITSKDIGDNETITHVYEKASEEIKVEVIVMSYVEYEDNLLFKEEEIAPSAQPTESPIPTNPVSEIPITFPPNLDPNAYIHVCEDMEWTDNNGNNCSFYTSQNICYEYGTDVNNLGLQTNSICSTLNQAECPLHKSLLNNELCTWDTSCEPKPISGSDACCTCGGGVLEIVFAPTESISVSTNAPNAPNAPPTTAPTNAPTEAPTSAPTSFAETEPVLGIKGLAEFATTGYKDWIVPLYVYNLQGYNLQGYNPGSEQYIEEIYFGPLQAPLGEYPKYNVTSGQFDGMPNAIVPLPADEIPTPSGITLKTEPVPGLPGFYYLFIKAPDCDGKYLALYTQPASQFVAKYAPNYYSKLGPSGNFLNTVTMLGCINTDYSCLCDKGDWKPDSSRYIDYPPIPNELLNCPVASVPPASSGESLQEEIEAELIKNPYLNVVDRQKSCRLGADLDLLKIQNTGRSSILFLAEPQDELKIEGDDIPINVNVVFDNRILYGHSLDDMKNTCPNEYTDCMNDLNCANAVQQIVTDWDVLKQESSGDILTLFRVFAGGTQVKNTSELYRLKVCVNEINNEMYDSKTKTCGFLKDYYKYCKSSTDTLTSTLSNTSVKESIDGGITGGGLEITMSEVLELFSVLFFEPMCIYASTQKDNEFWMKLFGETKKNLLKTFFYIIKEAIDGGLDIESMGITDACGMDINTIRDSLNLESLDLDAFPISAGDYAYQQFDPWGEIQTSCCTEYDPTVKPTYKPLPDDAQIMCEDTPSSCTIQ